MKLKILSWNIWYDGDFGKIKKFLEDFDADIIGLGEVVPDDPTRDTVGLMKKLGYEHVVAPVFVIPKDSRTMSNGLFSKFPIVKSKIHILPDPKTNTRNAIQADIDVQGKIIHVFMTHLLHTHQKSDLVQDSQIDELIKLLPKKNTIAMGDFNMTPESEGIKKMREVMQDAELAPVPTLDPKLFDCKVCDRDKIPTTRLDYIFTSKDIKSDSFKVHDSYGSDHLPISVNLEV